MPRYSLIDAGMYKEGGVPLESKDVFCSAEQCVELAMIDIFHAQVHRAAVNRGVGLSIQNIEMIYIVKRQSVKLSRNIALISRGFCISL